MPARRDRIPALLALLVASCAPPPAPPVVELAVVTQPTRPPVDEGCEKAARHRARVAKLLAEGRLERSLRVLALADRLCPATAAESEADRKAAHAEFDAPAPPGGGDALLKAGLAAKQAGRAAEAQRLFDRALAEMERAAHRAGDTGARVTVEVPNGFRGNVAGAAWVRIDGAPVLAVAHEDTVTLLDTTTWYRRGEIHAPRNVTAIAASPDGKTLATGSDQALRLWDPATGKERARQEGHHELLAWSADGKVIVTAGEHTVEVWRPGDAAPAKAIPVPVPAKQKEAEARIRAVAASARGDFVVTGHQDGSVSAFRTRDGKAIWTVKAHKKRALGLAVSPDGKQVASSGADGVKLWDAAHGKPVRELSHRHASTVAWSPDGATVLAPSGAALQGWSAATGKETVRAGGMGPQDLAFDPEGKRMAGTKIDAVTVWDAASGQTIHTIAPHAEAIQATAWMPGGEAFVSAGWDGTVRVWDGRTGAPRRTFTGEEAESMLCVAVSPDGSLIAAGSTAPRTTIWNVATGEPAYVIGGKDDWISAVAFSRSGKLLAVSSGKEATLLSPGSWRTVLSVGPAADEITSLAFSPDQHLLAMGSRSGELQLWDTDGGRKTGSLVAGNTVSGLAFRSDGGSLIAGANEGLIIDPHGASLIRELEGHAGYVSAMAFEPGEERVASGSSDHLVRLWDFRAGTLIRELQGHTAMVNALAYRPDGKWLLSGSDDGSMRLWPASGGASLVIRTVTHSQDAYAFTAGPEGRIQFFGDGGRAFPVCRLGEATYPFDLCRDRVETPTLFAAVTGGDEAALDP